ncbi:MAG TPA: hypothetical protein PLN85_00260 [archaeon]|nr:hypothetical protein [archaeon]
MDIKKYDTLRNKINKKDFEGKNKSLDKWLYRFSFFGNIGSIFFAYFLVYPSLQKAIKVNLIDGIWNNILSFLFTVIFLTMFEIIKRYIVRNFSHDFIINANKIKFNIITWFIVLVSVVVLSFYLSISGSKNLADTNHFSNIVVNKELSNKLDSINRRYDPILENLTIEYSNYINDARETVYSNKRDAFTEKSTEIANRIDKLKQEKEKAINIENDKFSIKLNDIQKEDSKIIFLFIIIVVFNELIIIGGVYFREYFEYNLYLLNKDYFEKIYTKRDRYRSLLMFIYNEGKLNVGDKVIPGLELKSIISERTNIQNSNKMVDDFLQEMDKLGVFVTSGKRRYIGMAYNDAMLLIENYDSAFRILENMK